jgi:hypothetical protein
VSNGVDLDNAGDDDWRTRLAKDDDDDDNIVLSSSHVAPPSCPLVSRITYRGVIQ